MKLKLKKMKYGPSIWKEPERNLAEEQKLKISSNYENISHALDKQYAQNGDVWVESIVKNVLGE